MEGGGVEGWWQRKSSKRNFLLDINTDYQLSALIKGLHDVLRSVHVSITHISETSSLYVYYQFHLAPKYTFSLRAERRKKNLWFRITRLKISSPLKNQQTWTRTNRNRSMIFRSVCWGRFVLTIVRLLHDCAFYSTFLHFFSSSLYIP